MRILSEELALAKGKLLLLFAIHIGQRPGKIKNGPSDSVFDWLRKINLHTPIDRNEILESCEIIRQVLIIFHIKIGLGAFLPERLRHNRTREMSLPDVPKK